MVCCDQSKTGNSMPLRQAWLEAACARVKIWKSMLEHASQISWSKKCPPLEKVKVSPKVVLHSVVTGMKLGNSIKTSNSNVRELQKFTSGGILTLRVQWDHYRWPQRSSSRSKFKVKPKILLKLAIWMWKKYKSLQPGVNRPCEFNVTNTDDLRGHLQGQSSRSNLKFF